ncbi:MAG: transposase [Phycisphaerales bacterium]
MGMYHFTFHAYRSWNADRPHARRDRRGIQQPNVNLAKHRDAIAVDPPVQFDVVQQTLLKLAAEEVCRNLKWTPHAAAVTPTHVHVLIDLGEADTKADANAAAVRMKRILGYKLTKATGTKGHRWFSRGGDVKPVDNEGPYAYLLTEYLPDHVNQAGKFWDLRQQ